MTRIIGHVSALQRFPVKSMAGEQLGVAEVDWQGIEGDRQYAFYHQDNGTRFPWMTARDVPAMVLHKARFVDPASPKTSAMMVKTPEGDTVPLQDARLRTRLEAAAGGPLGLMQVARGIHDAMPISIQTTAGHAELERAHGHALDPRRFRINVTIESERDPREFRGLRLAFGGEDGALLHCADPIPRCVMITIDPDTAAKDVALSRTVARRFGNTYGLYAGPARPGLIRLGDMVRIID